MRNHRNKLPFNRILGLAWIGGLELCSFKRDRSTATLPTKLFPQRPQLPSVAPRLTVVTKAENDSHLNGIGLHYHGQVGESGSHYGGWQRPLGAARRKTRQK